MKFEWIHPAVFTLEGYDAVKWRQDRAMKIPGAEHSKQYREKKWDGKYYPGFRMEANPPRIFFWRGYFYEVARSFPDVPFPSLPLDDQHPAWRVAFEGLRDYQQQTLNQLLRGGWRRTHQATNAGKGAVIARFSQYMAQTGHCTLILCGEIAVFEALQEQLAEWSTVPLGLLREGRTDIPPEATVLAMRQTLRKRINTGAHGRDHWLRWLASFHAVLIDEADVGGYEPILEKMKNTYWRGGFSGTWPAAGTLEDLKQLEILGHFTARSVRNTELIEREISARPWIKTHHLKWKIPPRPDGWSEMPGASKRRWIYEQVIHTNLERHEYIRQLVLPEQINVVIVRSVAHGRALAEYLAAPFLHGGTTPAVRTATLDAVTAGEITLLVATTILDRGTNRLGWATNLILASGEGSSSQTLQRIGRGLRRSGGKEFVTVHDLLDTGHTYLNSLSKARVRVYHSEQFDVELVRGV